MSKLQTRMVFDCETTKAMGIADGEYELRTNMADYRSESDEFITLQWATDNKVNVIQGQWDVDSVLKASEHLMDSCGYHGVYVEQLDYNIEDNFIELTVGS
tara:strand:- start:574 stop:876 length:303 start_codon:yes stop_codon:yes gene_type:complete